MAASVELRTRVKGLGTKRAVVVLDVLLLPRGSGNRTRARRLADAFRKHELMGPHISRVVCGASRVTVHLRASAASVAALAELMEREKRKDVEGQLPLFA